MAAKKKKPASDDKVEVRTPNVASYRARVDATKYAAMKRAILAFLPKKAPGMTQAEMMEAASKVDKKTFPGKTSSWWMKCVQLDLEARGVVVREKTAKPLRWHRA